MGASWIGRIFATKYFSATFTIIRCLQLVEKQSFNLLVSHFNALQPAEVNQLPDLVSAYPYSQLLHALCARGFQDLNLDGKEKWLQKSAVYATDRAVLKWVITSPRLVVESTVSDQTAPAAGAHPTPRTTTIGGDSAINGAIEPNAIIETITETAPEDPLYEIVARDVQALAQSKMRFEALVAQLESANHPPMGEPGAEESLIKELEQHAKKRVKVDSKRKEQSDIIEKFIKAQPAIPKPKAGAAASVDLTEKTSVLGKDVISETLVDLLIKQGKKERAIEMLKKLIWKFPQKKAYFAARIRELK